MNLATGPLVNLFAEDLTVYLNGGQGAQMVYYEQSLGKWNRATIWQRTGSVRLPGTLPHRLFPRDTFPAIQPSP